jgi:hypothetical protein
MDNTYTEEKKAKGVWYNDIYFGSKAECKLYQCLLKYNDNYELYVHKPVTVTVADKHKWKIDFTLKANSYKQCQKFKQLLFICNEELTLEHISEVYIEYKGYSDYNYKKHMDHAVAHKSGILNRLIIVSEHPSAYINENIHNRTRYKKLITSYKAFIYWIDHVYC